MKVNEKNRKIIIIFAVLILMIVALGLFFHKSQQDKINAEIQNKSDLKTQEANKNSGTTTKGNATNNVGKPGENAAKVGSKDTGSQELNKKSEQEKASTAKIISTKEGLTVYVKAANFGSTADIDIDKSKFNSSCKYYQFYIGDKKISAIEAITKAQTTIFPAQEAGSEVVISLLDGNKKVIEKLNIKLSQK